MEKWLDKITCCPNGIVELKVTIPTPKIIYWEHPLSGQSGIFDTSQVAANKHPLTTNFTPIKEGHPPYRVRLKFTYGDLSFNVFQNSHATCNPPFTRIIMTYYNEWWSGFYEEERLVFERPSDLPRTIFGAFWYAVYDQNGLVFTFADVRNDVYWLDKVEVIDLFYVLPNDANLVCPRSKSCIFQIQDKTGYPVFQKQFTETKTENKILPSSSKLCPQVLSGQCFSNAENEEVIKYFLEYSDVLEGDILEGITRTIKEECLAVYQIEENSRYGIEITKITKTTTIIYSPPGEGEMPTEFTEESTEESTVRTFWAPNGCSAPNYSLLCQNTETCPPNTAYSCKRGDGRTCCYDCDGNVITVIE